MIIYKTILLVLFFGLITTATDAQALNKVKVSNHIEMTYKMDEVWTTVSDLSNLETLVPSIVSKAKMIGNGKGSMVTLTLRSNGLKVVEKVTQLNNQKYVLGYKMIETPMPILDYKATIRILPLKTTGYTIYFDAGFKVNEKNRASIEAAIDNFQKKLLTNIKKTYNHEK